MKKRFEIILLDWLWLSAITLFASFWFDIRFGFNIFSGSHWHYLAIQQLSPGRILPLFYISMAIFVAIGILGLYLINHPHKNKTDSVITPSQPPKIISVAEKENDTLPGIHPTAPDPSYSPLPPAPTLPRPPRIVGSLQQMVTPAPAMQQNPVNFSESNNMDEKLKELFETAGYIVKQSPRINGLKLNLWAVGMDETLYIGLTDSHGGEITAIEGGDSKWKSANGDLPSPVWKLNQSVEKIRALFDETLDKEIKINIKSFVLMNNATITNRDSLQKIWAAFDVDVFESIDQLKEFLDNNKNREMGSEEQEDFDAYSDYIDTVANYFNKT